MLHGVGMCPRRPRLPRGRPRSTLRRCSGSRPGSGWVRVGPLRSRPRAHPNVADAGVSCRAGSVCSTGPTAPTTKSTHTSPARGSRSHRPLGRVSSSLLPAVHLAPIDPVVSRGSPERCRSGVSRLGVGFPLRCLQRFAWPNVATQRCRFPDNWLTSGSFIPVLSY